MGLNRTPQPPLSLLSPWVQDPWPGVISPYPVTLQQWWSQLLKALPCQALQLMSPPDLGLSPFPWGCPRPMAGSACNCPPVLSCSLAGGSGTSTGCDVLHCWRPHRSPSPQRTSTQGAISPCCTLMIIVSSSL